jgi:uncharacterized protein (DUF58 family)
VTDLVFPLIPMRRGAGLEVAGRATRRRGTGSDIASTRTYRRGDAIKLVDWAASARLSTARGSDEFVVRDHYAEDAVRVVVVLDRSPSMGLCASGLPWLRKPEAVRIAASAIVASAAATSALVGFAEAGDEVWVEHPRRDPALRLTIERRIHEGEPDGALDSLDLAIGELARNPSRVPSGTFVFLVSDFFPPPSPDSIRLALSCGWDLVPVLVQDPLWERSFPDVAGVTLPLADPSSGAVSLVRLSRRELQARRDENERRSTRLDESLDELGLDWVQVTASDPLEIHAAFLRWADGRVSRLRGYR